MGLDLGAALAAYSSGQQINANLAATQADTQLKMQSLAQGQQTMELQRQQMQQRLAAQAAMQKIVEDQQNQQPGQASAADPAQPRAMGFGFGNPDATDSNPTGAPAPAAAAQVPPQAAQEQALQGQIGMYRKLSAANIMADPATAEAYSKMADSAEGRLGTLRTQNAALEQKKNQQVASFAGSVLDGSTSPQDAFQWAKDNLGLQEALRIPSDPEQAKNYWKAKQDLGLSAAEQLQQALSVQQAKDRKEQADQASQDRQDAIAERKAEAAARQAALNTAHQDAQTAHAEAAAARAQVTAINQTERINTSLQRTAKPFLDDKQRLDQVGGLLQQGTPEADQQAHQALTSLLGNFKGRATSQFYKDNANFGSLAGRLSGALAHGFSGQYKDTDRLGLLGMVNQLRSNVVEPTLNNLELQTKKRAAGYKLDPDQVQIEGDFQRSATPTNLGDANGATYNPAGAPTPAPKPSAPAAFSEGQTATNTAGHRIIFHQGKWVAQ